MRIDVFRHEDPDLRAISDKLDYLLHTVKKIYSEVIKMSQVLDNLTAEVTEIETQADSIIALCQGLSDLLVAAKEDPVAIQALADSLQAKAKAIADAVVANTPVPPAV